MFYKDIGSHSRGTGTWTPHWQCKWHNSYATNSFLRVWLSILLNISAACAEWTGKSVEIDRPLPLLRTKPGKSRSWKMCWKSAAGWKETCLLENAHSESFPHRINQWKISYFMKNFRVTAIALLDKNIFTKSVPKDVIVLHTVVIDLSLDFLLFYMQLSLRRFMILSVILSCIISSWCSLHL